jgi:hypothetical protein
MCCLQTCERGGRSLRGSLGRLGLDQQVFDFTECCFPGRENDTATEAHKKMLRGQQLRELVLEWVKVEVE